MSLRIHFSVQNSTNELLSVEGSSVLNGSWDEGATPEQGEVLSKQSHRSWSMTRAAGQIFWMVGWVRLGCTKGYFKLAFDFQTQETADLPDGFAPSIIHPSMLHCESRVTGQASEDIYFQVFIHPLTAALAELRAPGAPRDYEHSLSLKPAVNLVARARR